MPTSRKLTVRREFLTEIGAADLRAVAAAAEPTALATLQVTDCLSAKLNCESSLRPCISHTCTL